MWPQREGYDEPEPTGHPDSARAMYSAGWPVNRHLGMKRNSSRIR